MSRKFGLLPCPPCPSHLNSILSGFTTHKTNFKASVVLNDSLGKALGNGVTDKGFRIKIRETREISGRKLAQLFLINMKAVLIGRKLSS